MAKNPPPPADDDDDDDDGIALPLLTLVEDCCSRGRPRSGVAVAMMGLVVVSSSSFSCRCCFSVDVGMVAATPPDPNVVVDDVDVVNATIAVEEEGVVVNNGLCGIFLLLTRLVLPPLLLLLLLAAGTETAVIEALADEEVAGMPPRSRCFIDALTLLLVPPLVLLILPMRFLRPLERIIASPPPPAAVAAVTAVVGAIMLTIPLL